MPPLAAGRHTNKMVEPKCPNCGEHNGPLEFKTDLGQGDEMVCEDCYNELESEEDESECEFCGEDDTDNHECRTTPQNLSSLPKADQ